MPGEQPSWDDPEDQEERKEEGRSPKPRHAVLASSPTEIEKQEKQVAKLRVASRLKSKAQQPAGSPLHYSNLALDGIRDLARKLEIPEEVLIEHVHFSSAFLKPGSPGEELPSEDSEKISRIDRIYTMASEVFMDKDEAREWMLQPAYGLGGRLPLDLLNTRRGAKLVQDLLGAIHQGNYW